MEKFLVNEEQRKDILLMHMALKNNQKSRIIKEQSSQPDPIKADKDLLNKAKELGCLKNGMLKTNASRTKVIYRAKSRTGKIVDFYPNMTYKYKDGSKQGTWPCPRLKDTVSREEDTKAKIETLKSQDWKTLDELRAEKVDLNTLDKTHEKTSVGNTILYRQIGKKNVHYDNTSTDEFNAEQQSFIKKYTDLGYKINPTRVEQGYMMPNNAVELGAPPDLFPNGLIIWNDPQDRKNLSKSEVEVALQKQSISPKDCKGQIQAYYNLYQQRTSAKVDKVTFDKSKNIVQACKDQHYRDWPWWMAGGKKLDSYLDILSGDVAGGPSGEFKYFKLK